MAGWPARLALRGRRAADLTHALVLAGRAGAGRRERLTQELQRRLEACDVRRRLTALRARLATGVTRLNASMATARLQAGARLGVLAGQLGSLSPLAVLGRGYAVCWNAERSAVIRSTAAVSPGDRVTVTLQQGELSCEVKSTTE